MSEAFQPTEVNRPFLEPIDTDKVRLNITLDRMVTIQYLNKAESIEVDVARMSPAVEKISRCFLDGLSLFIKNGIPTTESVTQIDQPIGDKWVGCKITAGKDKKSTFKRDLDDDEKITEALAHVESRLEMLYGIREMQTRASNLNPLAEELRKIVASVAVNPKSGLTDSGGTKWKASTLPSVLCKGATNVATIEAAANSIGLGDSAVASFLIRAQENVERAKLDDLLSEMDLSV